MPPEQLNDTLRALTMDERFAAVLAWLDRNRDAFVAAGSKQNLAGDHGKLAHAQGSVHAMNLLLAQIGNMMAGGGATGGMAKPEETE